MYESFFGLSRRPFSATPDPACWFRSPRYQAALDELLICAEQGQGISVLVAPAGAGKTLICERLIREIGEPFTSVLLRHATYNTRRGFLQTLLCELAQPYDRHTDQELRLALAPVLKGMHQLGRALLLVIDEAHQLSESLLEELRILADQAEDGQPIVRLVLAGQFSLEEKLAHPALQAMNQRLRAQVTLEPLSLAESADYIDFRITWGGGRTSQVFTDDAIQAICRAADGLPRCLNQLCDHSLLLAFVNEQRPVTADTIRTALEDLKHLPLAWNLSPSQIQSASESIGSTNSTVLEWQADAGVSAMEPTPEPVFEADVELSEMEPESDPAEELGFEEWHDEPAETDSVATVAVEDGLHDEPVYDRYNALDAGLEPAVLPTEPPLFAGLPFDIANTVLNPRVPVAERLEVVQDLLDVVQSSGDAVEIPARESSTCDETEECTATDDGMQEPVTQGAAVFEFGGDDSGSYNPPSEPAIAAPPQKRSCRNLFTRLRRKQLGR